MASPSATKPATPSATVVRIARRIDARRSASLIFKTESTEDIASLLNQRSAFGGQRSRRVQGAEESGKRKGKEKPGVPTACPELAEGSRFETWAFAVENSCQYVSFS